MEFSITGRLKGAEQVTIRYRKITDHKSAGPSFPVGVYIKEKVPSEKVLNYF